MRVIYSFNKVGYEAECWEREIKAASSDGLVFVPFNHGSFLDPRMYYDAWQLDRLYRGREPLLMRMYSSLERCLRETHADALLVTNCPPYHPDFLLRLKIYRALFSTDDPEATYRRTIPYLHAYHHVFFCSPAYGRDTDMLEKMRSCGMVNADWLPIGVFDFEFAGHASEDELFRRPRDIEVIYIGSFWRQKIDTLMKVKKALGSSFKLYGTFLKRHNLYINARYGYGGWVSQVSFGKRVSLYQRAKIGFNIHWDQYTLGNQRLYHLPANGVFQISDCAKHVGRILEVGKEVEAYETWEELVEKVRYYLAHEKERLEIARRGYERVVHQYRFGPVTRRAAALIREGMGRIGWA